MQVVLFVMMAFALLIIVSGIYVFVVACVRTKELSWLDSESLKGTSYEKYSKLIHNTHNWLVGHRAQDVYVQSSDGLKLHGLWIPVKEPKGTVILAHGYHSTMLVDFGMVLELYHSMGMNLLLPEHRGHGKSQGKLITFGVKESEDMLCWIEYHNNTFGYHQLILSGLSMGASTMMYLADRKLPDNVKGLVVDCGFSSPAAILSQVFKRTTHLPAVPFIWVTEICARVFGGFSLYERDSRKVLRHNHLPIIMVHGKADDFVPCEMTEQGFKNCAGEKQLLLAEGAGHGLSFLYAKEEYTKMVIDFLKKNIEGF